MNANKIELNGEVLLDLTQDTVTEADVAEGKTFHLADGTPATGTGVMGGGGGTLVVKRGTFTPTGTTHTVTHGLGVTPLFARIFPTTGFPSVKTARVLYFADGISTELANLGGITENLVYGAFYNSSRSEVAQVASSDGIDYTSSTYPICKANQNTITFGATNYQLVTTSSYEWMIVGYVPTE